MTLTAEPVRRPKLVDGTELVGEYQGSGYEEPRYLVKRADGQMIVLSQLMYLVVQSLREAADSAEAAAHVSRAYGRGVSPDNIDYLIEKRLQPLGVAVADGSQPLPTTHRAHRGDQADVLHLTVRASMLPPRLVNAAADLLRHLFHPFLVVAVCVAVVVADTWLIRHGLGRGLEETLLEPLWLLFLLGGIVASAAFHEFGHAAACRYGGARPGAIGVGLYLIWPAFYTEVTDSYRLSRAGRLRTDLGGIYFNLIFALGTFALYGATGWEPLLVLVLFQHIEIVHQFVPVVRLDGYYVVSDLAGVPDLFKHIGPTARRLLRRQAAGDENVRLRPAAQRIITIWLVVSAPILAVNLGLLFVNTPRIFDTSTASLRAQASFLSDAVQLGEWIVALLAVISILLLALPLIGITFIYAKLARAVSTKSAQLVRRSVQRRSARPAPVGASVNGVAPRLAGRPRVSTRGARRMELSPVLSTLLDELEDVVIRPDGRVTLVPTPRSSEDLARAITIRLGRPFDATDVEQLIDEGLRPLELVRWDGDSVAALTTPRAGTRRPRLRTARCRCGRRPSFT